MITKTENNYKYYVGLILLCVLLLGDLPMIQSASAAQSETPSIKMTLSKDAYWYKPGSVVRLNVTLINATEGNLDEVSIRVKVHAPDKYRSDMDNTLKNKPIKNYRINKLMKKDETLKPGDNKFDLDLLIPTSWFSDGVYPLTVETLESNKVESSVVTQLIIMSGFNPEKQVPLKLATVFDVSGKPNRYPDGFFVDTDLAKDCSTNDKEECWTSTVVEELTKRENFRCAIALSPLILEEMDEMSDGFTVEKKGKKKEYEGDSNESSFTSNAISDLSAMAADDRFQFLDTPYAYPNLEKLSQMGWSEDSSDQIVKGRETYNDVLGTAIGEDYFFPPALMLNSNAISELKDVVGKHLVLSPKLLERNDKGKRLEKGMTLSNPVDIQVGDDGSGATAIFSDRRLEELIESIQSSDDVHGVTQLILAELTNLFLERPASMRSCVMLWPNYWRPSNSVTREVISTISNVPWLQTSTLEDCFTEVKPIENASLEIPAPDTKPGSYYTDVNTARDSLTDYSNITFPDNPFTPILTDDLYVSESTIWEEYGSKAEGLKYSSYVKFTVEEELDKIIIPVSAAITLTSGEGDVPISVVNGTNYKVKAVLKFQSNGLSFPEGDSKKAVLEPKENLFEIAVKAEKDGRVPLSATLEGQGLIIDNVTFSVLTSTFNTFAIILVSGLLGLIGLIWAIKIFTKRRVGKHKRRQLMGAEQEEDEEGS
ncbi:MAG: hypothetical protein JW738_03775 [Actinobacteria bacterium]|nr:hypothetical protein [Actinomycetota bacterium]